MLGFMEGYRIGSIESVRNILIRTLNSKGKKQDTVVSKKILRNISREIDGDFLEEIMYSILADKLSVKELDMYYDMFFLIYDENENKKILWRCPGGDDQK